MFTEFAPAKINLSLHVTGQRPDGYHTLQSLVAFADVGDTVSVMPNETGVVTLQMQGEYAAMLGAAQDNLVMRAAGAVKKAFGVNKGAAITLTKNLPVAAGIGGGSADAAATLRALRRAWELPDGERWQTIAMELGADVPVCLASRTSQVSGIGEITGPAEAPPLRFIVLVNPNLPLMTKDVFTHYDIAAPRDIATHTVDTLLHTRNDLEAAAISIVPAIKDILALLSAQGGCQLARMSGSGATCFGLFAQEQDAAAATAAIWEKYPNWWVKTARIPYGGHGGQAQ